MKSKVENVEWVDILKPQTKDIEFLKKKFRFHDVILKEIAEPSVRAHVERYDGYIFMVYYFPIFNPHEQTSRRAEIDFLITKNAVVTVHYEPLELLNEFHDFTFKNSLDLVYKITSAFFRFEERQLRHIASKVEAIGNELFQNREREVLKKVSRLKRDISEYRIIVRLEESILSSLLQHGPSLWGDESRVYLNDLLGEHLKIVNQIENYREAVLDFEETNNQLMNSKTTEVMKTFTILSFLTFPFVLAITLLGLPLPGNPLAEFHSFWFVFGAIVVGIVGLVAYFKKKGWL